LYYKDIRKQLKVPYVIYSDFESLLIPIEGCMKNYGYTTRKLIVNVTVVVSRSSNFPGHVTVVSYPIFTELFVAYVTIDGLFERFNSNAFQTTWKNISRFRLDAWISSTHFSLCHHHWIGWWKI
jgi:hypothetical protein